VTIDPQSWCRIEPRSELLGLTLVVTKSVPIDPQGIDLG